MMSCGACSKWQHINCHDRADIEAGHEKRNWDTEEFTCRTCRTRVPNTTGAYRLDPKDSHAATQSPRNGPYTNNRGLYVPRPVDYMSAKSSENLTGTRNYPAATNSGYYERQLSHGSGSPGSLNHTTHTQPYQPHATIPFTYHQPDQRGFATSQAHQLHPSETSNSSQPPPSSPHFPQHPNAGSHPPGSFRHIHDREPVPHIQATNSAEWNVPLPSRNRSYSSYNGVTTLPASRYLQERDTCVGQQPGAVQWQPSDQPLQLPAFPYHQTALFHTPFQTPQ